MYLGDGSIYAPSAGNANLHLTLDSAYPDVVAECAGSIGRLLPGIPVQVYPEALRRRTTIQASFHDWPRLLPQHGKGRKHTRPIVLEPWQREIVDLAPEAFLRGLIHSDGCRTVNRFKTKLPSGRVGEYEYPRYFFSNLSEDIRNLFCEYCERLGIRWTQSNHRNISVSHRYSVAKLDAFIGPKA